MLEKLDEFKLLKPIGYVMYQQV